MVKLYIEYLNLREIKEMWIMVMMKYKFFYDINKYKKRRILGVDSCGENWYFFFLVLWI